VCTSSHFGVLYSSTSNNNAYTKAYTAVEDFKAMSWYSATSVPSHLHASKACAPSASASGLPQEFNFDRVRVRTTYI